MANLEKIVDDLSSLTVLEAAAGPAMERLGGRSSRSRVALLGSVVDELIERRSRRAA